jgi:hypothetical protein
MLSSKAPEIVKELLDEGNTHCKSFLRKNRTVEYLRDLKFYLSFRNEIDSNTKKQVFGDISNWKGVSDILHF